MHVFRCLWECHSVNPIIFASPRFVFSLRTPCAGIAYLVPKSAVSTASALRRIQATVYDVFRHTKYLNTQTTTNRSAMKCFSMQLNVKLINVFTQAQQFRHYTPYTLHGRNVDKQDKQCTYNVTLRRVRVTIVAVEKQ
jgi:hypothetical protein